MTVKIRLEALSVGELDAHEIALRWVLDIPATASRDYPNRRRAGAGASGIRRYLESTGTRIGQMAAPTPAQAPRMVAEQAKTRRDLGGELGALMAADRDLTRQPWYPLRPGDVVLSYLPGDDDIPVIGETFLAVTGDTDCADNAMLRLVSTTYQNPTAPDEPVDPEPMAFYDLWFESEPSSLTVIRAGAVIHGQPTHTPATGR